MMWNNHNYKTIYYYKLNDIAEASPDINIFSLEDLQQALHLSSLTNEEIAVLNPIYQLAQDKFSNWIWIRSEKELSLTLVYSLWNIIMRWKNVYYDMYKTLLTNYQSLQNKLIDKINSTTTVDTSSNNYDDDTPQNKIVDGVNIFDKSHASYYRYGDGNQTQESDVDTMYNIQKLDMLKNMIFNVKDEWATTLKDFIISASYEDEEYDE